MSYWKLQPWCCHEQNRGKLCQVSYAMYNFLPHDNAYNMGELTGSCHWKTENHTQFHTLFFNVFQNLAKHVRLRQARFSMLFCLHLIVPISCRKNLHMYLDGSRRNYSKVVAGRKIIFISTYCNQKGYKSGWKRKTDINSLRRSKWNSSWFPGSSPCCLVFM